MIGISMTAIAESLFSLDLAGVGPTLLLVSLAITLIALAGWYIGLIAVALVVMYYTKSLIASIMAILALAGGIAWATISGWPKQWEMATIATFICLLALCVLFILREQTEVFG